MGLEVRPGRNVWVLGRTDRDGPSQSDAQETAGAWLARIWSVGFLPPGQTLPDGSTRYYLDAARPIDVLASQTRPALPEGQQAWHFETDQPDALALRAENPWYVLVDFDWRGPTKAFADWPKRSVNQFGFPSDDPAALDWLLLEARYVGKATRTDSTWREDVKPGIELGIGGLAALALLWLLGSRR